MEKKFICIENIYMLFDNIIQNCKFQIKIYINDTLIS